MSCSWSCGVISTNQWNAGIVTGLQLQHQQQLMIELKRHSMAPVHALAPSIQGSAQCRHLHLSVDSYKYCMCVYVCVHVCVHCLANLNLVALNPVSQTLKMSHAKAQR